MKKITKLSVLLLVVASITCIDSVSDTIEVPTREKSQKTLSTPQRKVFENVIEHKINGRIDTIEIKPIIGHSYYLIENDNNLRKGKNHTRSQNDTLSNWRILQW